MQKAAIKLQQIQSELVAPKDKLNKFAGYNYRSAEGILEALKPHLEKHKAILTLSDEMVQVGDRVYVKAIATFTADGESVVTHAFAREPEDKKGSDASQITGAASSYARKYALNGLFCIDDTKDADATNDHGMKETTKPAAVVVKPTAKDEEMVDKIIEAFKQQTTLTELDAKMKKAEATPYAKHPRVLLAYTETKNNIK
jgi:hypothetical protein